MVVDLPAPVLPMMTMACMPTANSVCGSPYSTQPIRQSIASLGLSLLRTGDGGADSVASARGEAAAGRLDRRSCMLRTAEQYLCARAGVLKLPPHDGRQQVLLIVYDDGPAVLGHRLVLVHTVGVKAREGCRC